jgi:uracil-DNA glycosylase
MLIGHNFDTDLGFRASVARGAEDISMPTWRRLKELFIPDSGEDEDRFFFTNFYLGAMVHPEPKDGEAKKTSNTGKFRCSKQYHNACVKALKIQVDIVRPKVIALLGSNVPSAFSAAFPIFRTHCGSNLAETQSKQPTGGHRLQILPDLQVQVVSLYHPASYSSLETLHAQGLILRTAIHTASTS